MAGGLDTTDSRADPGHTIFYLAGEDTAADRHNIPLLARIAARCSTPLRVEVFYHRPLKLSNWALEAGSVRYTRLRSASDFVLAERIAASGTECVIFFNWMVLAHAEDLWRLLGHTAREPYVLALPGNTVGGSHETAWQLALRSARFDLARYTGSARQPVLTALNKTLLNEKSVREPKGLLLRKFYADLLDGTTVRKPIPRLLKGRSLEAAAPSPGWLATFTSTLLAWQIWREVKSFPWWFSYRHPLFLVAQLSFYMALLVLPVSAKGCLLLILFSFGITLRYASGGALRAMRSAIRSARRIRATLLRAAARVLLYIIG